MNIQTVGPRNFTFSGGRIRYNPWPEQPLEGCIARPGPSHCEPASDDERPFDVRTIYLHGRRRLDRY